MVLIQNNTAIELLEIWNNKNEDNDKRNTIINVIQSFPTWPPTFNKIICANDSNLNNNNEKTCIN